MVFHHRSYNPACLTDVCEVAFWALHLVYKTTFLSVRCFVLRMYQGGSNGVLKMKLKVKIENGHCE